MESKNSFFDLAVEQYQTWSKPAFFLLVVLIHLAVFLLGSRVPRQTVTEPDFTETKLFKLVDVQEYIPPAPVRNVRAASAAEPPKEAEPPASENVQESDDEPEEEAASKSEEEYVPQHKISAKPVFPARKILSRLEYPAMAKKQGIEGVVLLELCIDKTGKVRKITVLKDPGYGFAESAVKTMTGVQCVPALINGEPCAVRFRYPVRFKLS